MDTEPASAVALMSIHPQFAEGLMSGEKKVEFRRVAPREAVRHVVVYATQPVGAVIGAFEVAQVDRQTPERLWRKYGSVGGIARSAFFKYFEGTEHGFALVVSRSWRCTVPLDLAGPGLPSRPPQSFMYLRPSILERICDSSIPRSPH